MARRHLIPFPSPSELALPPATSFNPDDTVYAHPRPEHVFRPARRRLALPAAISSKWCAAGLALSFLAGVSVARLVGFAVEQQSEVAITIPAHHGTAAPGPLASVDATMPIERAATKTVSPATAARLKKFTFTLRESREFQQVGPFALRLKRADARRQTYTLALQMKDKQVEIRDRALAEPIRLQPAGVGASEIFIRRIEADQVEGILSTRN